MKIFIQLLCLISVVLAEPPVDDGYPLARSSPNDIHHDQHASDHQRSISQEYGTPDFQSSRSATSGYDYSAPNARSSNARSQYPPATVRVSFNQRFRSAASRKAQDHFGVDARSQDVLNARSGISQNYGTPSARSLSQKYGVPSIAAARSLSTEYGALNVRSSSSEEYDAPSFIAARSSSNSPTSFRSSPNGQSDPVSKSQFQAQSHNFSAQGRLSAFATRSASSSTNSEPSSQSISSSYGVPSARSADSFENHQKSPSESYGAPSTRSLSQENRTPSSRSGLNTNAIASTYSAPSSSYPLASRSALPSEQYGVPEQQENADKGYDYGNRARALEELLSQEPANYDFAYQIEDLESGSDFGHAETRQADRAEGSYFVVLPDGTKQTVEYEADEEGFKPRISLEPADTSARSGGYDDNAQDLVRSSGGPY